MTKNESIASMFAAGVDMFMIPDKANMLDYLRSVEFNLKNDTISMDRLNDAVARILSVKLALGLVDVSPSKE
jgi:beta-glucosidase